MQTETLLKALIAPFVVLVLIGIGWTTRNTWKPWLIPSKDQDAAKKDESDNPEKIKLTEQAQKNLRLVVKEVALRTYYRRITLPGTVVDRPGHSDRGIPAPIAGVITKVNAVPGKSIHVGDELFRLQVVSESFQASQMELYKNVSELEIAQKEYKRLKGFSEAVVPAGKLLELEYQQNRAKVLIHAYRQDLKTRQLNKDQIDKIETGEFVTEAIIYMPDRFGKQHGHTEEQSAGKDKNVEYGVQELKVNLGDHVQAGQILAYVADHRFLYIEGRALKQEVKLVTQAIKESLPVEAEFSSEDDDQAGERISDLRIEFLGNTMDTTGLTLPVYVPFRNPSLDYEHRGKTHHTGMYRPGQKVLLKVPVAKMTGVFVLPVAAIAREGPEAYVFKQSGDAFVRRPVNVIAEDADEVAIARDGSILEGQWIVHNAAAALNRVVKANQAEGGGGGHSHDH